MDGLLIVDKPVGPTSHDVVARVRRALGERRIGHTGTLDPLASGVLPLVLGRATRLARFLSASEKRYEAVVRLGLATDSYDAAGQPLGAPHDGPMPDPAVIERALATFRGTFLQQPPAFSAKKIGGIRSHALARQQRDASGAQCIPSPPPVSVCVSELELLGVQGCDVALRLTCSAGFYVRTLAHDLGRELGTGAHLAALRRTRAGDLRIEDATALDDDRQRRAGRGSRGGANGPDADDAAGRRAQRRRGTPRAARPLAGSGRFMRADAGGCRRIHPPPRSDRATWSAWRSRIALQVFCIRS